MLYQTLISPDSLYHALGRNDYIIVDCRFNLADTESGPQAYERSHIPGAVYAHLDNDLSGPPLTDHGRHPLPTQEAMLALFGRLGIDSSKQVVAYDNAGGQMAARLWWMLRYMGHEKVAVLDGSWQGWKAAGLPTTAGLEQNISAVFTGNPHTEWLVLKDEVQAGVPLLVDARAPERYRGEVEPLDRIAGHIPGAINYYFQDNLDENGRFHPPDQLRRQLQAILGSADPDQAVFYCGSGVTACHNLLALTHAGLGNGRLYAGSWSDWIAEY